MNVFATVKRIIVTIILVLIHLLVVAQGTIVQDSLETDKLIGPVEILPSFPGGFNKLNRFVNKHQKLKQIPQTTSGKVFVEFVVEKTGELTEIQIVRGLCESCDKEALRLVKAMPRWTPGSQGGRLVRTRMVLPVVFNQ